MTGNKKRIGIMTGGGDCPGLNAVIRAVVKTAINIYGYDVIGFKDGYLGLLYNKFIKLTLNSVSGILDKGGTILGTTNSFDPFNVEVDYDGEKINKDMSDRIVDNLKLHKIDCLIVVGGYNTILTGYKLSQKGINIIAIPKAIENDIPGTDSAFGFITAIDTATEALDKLHSTAESHHRVMILEVMGRRAGWVALEAGIAGGADIILIPEIPYDIKLVARSILERKNMGKNFSIICVSEGCKSKNNHLDIDIDAIIKEDKQVFNGVGAQIASALEKLTNLEVRVTVLGYLQRGGEPSPSDRLLTTRLGVQAVKLIADGEYNKMTGVVNHQTTAVDLADVAGKVKYVPVDGELIKIARNMGVSLGD
ncbi:MAG: 6-phosphofructokinase [Clostridiaceae bacterium]|nr:6-phosphofructokinase [Clostridiaceae bacterium]